MPEQVYVTHYHELWLKGRNRRFFIARLSQALRLSLAHLGLLRLEKPGDRILLHFREDAPSQEITARLARVFGVANYAPARSVARNLDSICEAAWEEMAPLSFENFAVRAKRSDKSFPQDSMAIESAVGAHLLRRLRETGRNPRVKLNQPELTCRIEITPGPALVYARRFPGQGGLPANSGGKMCCLLSGGFDSAVAAYRMMRRGAHLSFVHFFGGGAQPGESSIHVARELVRRLAPYQFSAKLFLVPLEAIQREIVGRAPETYRILLYRRMMLRIAERLAQRDHALALVTGDSLGQVASQTLQNMVAVGVAARLPVFRPLAGADKQEIIESARKIGTHDISSEPFHDCCPIFMPQNPALHASPRDLEAAEVDLDIPSLIRLGLSHATLVRFRYSQGRVEESGASARVQAQVGNSLA